MAKYVMAIDQGTTSSKAFIVDRHGEIVGQGGYEFRQIYPKPGWVEHDAVEIWETQKRACVSALKNASARPEDIEAIGITNQRETTVVWERETGRPVTNAIVWQCRRTADLCERLVREKKAESIRIKTGLIVDAYFSATKIQWILENIPRAMQRAEGGELCVGTIDSWLVYNLTGGRLHVTDPSNASRTMLYNINTGAWDREILGWLSIPEAMLPVVKSSSEPYGRTDPRVFGTEIPLCGIAGDQQAALFGQTCFERGDIKNTYGTGCFILANIGEARVFSNQGLVTSVGWKLGEKTTYVLEGSVFIAGAAVQWLRDGLGLIARSEEIERLARTVEDNGGVYFVPAFVGLGAPHWNMYARGTMTGITRGTTAGHLARATLESMAYQTRDVIESIESDFGDRILQLRVDGGAAENDLLMQFQADILGIPVLRPKRLQTTALGAAYLAGLAAGYWEGQEELKGLDPGTDRFTPAMGKAERQERCKRWRKLVEIAKIWGEDCRIWK